MCVSMTKEGDHSWKPWLFQLLGLDSSRLKSQKCDQCDIVARNVQEMKGANAC
jgi:hypothetical protein